MRVHTACAKAALITGVCGALFLPLLPFEAAASTPAPVPIVRPELSSSAQALPASAQALPASAHALPAVGSERPAPFDDTSDQSQPVSVTIEDLSPRILTSESSLTLSVVVTNTTGEPVDNGMLSVSVQTQTPPSLEELAHYVAGDRWEGQTVYEAPVGSSIPARSSVSVKLTIPREALPFDGDYAWGPRGVSVTLNGGTHTDTDRSVAIWDSGVDLVPAGAHVMIPWTTTTAPTRSDERSTIQALGSLTGASLAVDPALVTGLTTSDAGDSTSAEADDAQSGALSDFLTSHPIDFFPVFPFDADPALVTSVDTPQILDEALSSMTSLREARPHIPQIIWPSDEGFSTSVMRAFPGAAVLAPPGRMDAQEELDFTPAAVVAVDRQTGMTSVRGRSDDTSVVISHSALVAELLGWEATSTADSLDRDQLLASTGALFTRERPNVRRSFVSVLPRNQALTPDAVGRVRALMSPRWVDGQSLRDILDEEATDLPRHTVEDSTLSAADLRVGTRISDSLKRIAPVVSAAVDRPDVHQDVLSRTLACMSAGVGTTARALKALEFDAYAQTLAEGIRAESSATINLINKTANFPVRVTNSLEWDAQVTVTLAPSDPRLRVTHAVEALLPAQSTTTVEVPVSAIGAGDIHVTFIVSTMDGTAIDASQAVEVRLRAGWEDALTAVFGGLVAVAFIIGLIRTIRRRMRSHEVPGAGGRILQGMIPVSDHPVNQEDQ